MIIGICMALAGFIGMLVTVPLIEKFRPGYSHEEKMKVAVFVKAVLMVIVAAGCVLAIVFSGR